LKDPHLTVGVFRISL